MYRVLKKDALMVSFYGWNRVDRFTSPHGNYHISVCSPGAISPAWMVVFVPASGRPFSVIRTLNGYQPEPVSHTVSLTARLDADGYSQASIISILAAEISPSFPSALSDAPRWRPSLRLNAGGRAARCQRRTRMPAPFFAGSRAARASHSEKSIILRRC
jgi:hypothetical protein